MISSISVLCPFYFFNINLFLDINACCCNFIMKQVQVLDKSVSYRLAVDEACKIRRAFASVKIKDHNLLISL